MIYCQIYCYSLMFQEERRNAGFPFTEQQLSPSTCEQAKQARACSKLVPPAWGYQFQCFLLCPTKCTPSRKTIRGKVTFPDASPSMENNFKWFFLFPSLPRHSQCASVTDFTWISLQHSLCQTCCARDCCLSLLACPRCTEAPPTIWWKGKTSQTPMARSDRNLQVIGNL